MPGIWEEVEAVLDTLCLQPPELRFCEDCGSEMVNVSTLFFFVEGERKWAIPLPLCPKCSSSTYLKLASAEAA